jgi:hypothetical protein
MKCIWVSLLFFVSAPAAIPGETVSTHSGQVETVLFIGNSFLFGAGSPVRFYRAETVHDLNTQGIGGVPALFKAFTEQAGMNYSVCLETAPGRGLDFHYREKVNVIGKAWDHVVMQGYSLLDRDRPGDPALLIRSVGQVAGLLRSHNPKVGVRLIATWSRADQVYSEKGPWHGRPVDQMALDVRHAYDAAASSASIASVIPVGEAWNRAMKTGVADPNPYDGVTFGQVDLWTYDHYHASTFGYYLEALMIFGDLTGLDPRSLGKSERCAFELGLSQEQAVALQKVAYDQLSATREGRR